MVYGLLMFLAIFIVPLIVAYVYHLLPGKSLTQHSFGVWAWGGIATALGVSMLFVIITGIPSPVYGRVEGAATAIGAVVASTALTWSWFFQTHKNDSTNFERINQSLAQIVEEIKQIKRG